MNLTWRDASDSDIGLLADWNRQLIREEQHRNGMTVAQLAERMRNWLKKGEYRAVLFSADEPVCHAVFRRDTELIHLRQFFVRPDRRRSGIGRAAVAILREQIWPRDVRLTVDVLCHNQGGAAFWRSVGYRDYNLTLEIMPL
jgi:GNAT superfamily N-acetyltransferase